MTTLFFSPPACELHDPNPQHPECPDRLDVILEAMDRPDFRDVVRCDARRATEDELLLVHTPAHVRNVFEGIPSVGLNFLDPSGDTAVCPRSGEAALFAAGAVVTAVDKILQATESTKAFCAVRPPGHHAERNRICGFCLFNNIAIGAAAAIACHGLKRVAIIDIDVHHGNGTQDIAWDRDDMFYASIHQSSIFPGTGYADEHGAHNTIINVPMPAGTTGDRFYAALNDKILPQLRAFKPEMLFVSAGFDAHKDDPIGGFVLSADDFGRIMMLLRKFADETCKGRLVAVLEGGYDLPALKDSFIACMKALL